MIVRSKATLTPLVITLAPDLTFKGTEFSDIPHRVLVKWADNSRTVHRDSKGGMSFGHIPLLQTYNHALTVNLRGVLALVSDHNLHPELELAFQRQGRRRLEQHTRVADILRCSLYPCRTVQFAKIDWKAKCKALCTGCRLS